MHLDLTNEYADVKEVSSSIYKGIQPQAIQLVGGIFSCHGRDWPLYYKVYFDRNWSMVTLYISGDIHKVVLVSRESLL